MKADLKYLVCGSAGVRHGVSMFTLTIPFKTKFQFPSRLAPSRPTGGKSLLGRGFSGIICLLAVKFISFFSYYHCLKFHGK